MLRVRPTCEALTMWSSQTDRQTARQTDAKQSPVHGWSTRARTAACMGTDRQTDGQH
jgi:hypothetical protein